MRSGASWDFYPEKMYMDSLGDVWVTRVLSFMVLFELLVGTGVTQRGTLALLLRRWLMLGLPAANWGSKRPDSAHSQTTRPDMSTAPSHLGVFLRGRRLMKPPA